MSEITVLDVQKPDVQDAILTLQKQAFGVFETSTYEHILCTAPKGAIGYGVYEGSELVAFNGFIGHSVHKAGVTGVAYQSCMSATRKDQKGKGHFSNIIEFAKQNLKERGAAFIFGFPNHNSSPIFVNRLGFTVSNNTPCIYLRSPVFSSFQLNQERLLDRLSEDDKVYFDIRETADWKRLRSNTFFETDDLTNYIFGRVVTKNIKGIKIPLLIIGGYEINKPLRFGSLIQRALKKNKALVARLNANSGGPVAHSSRFTRPENLTEPTIAFPLNWNVNASDVEACGGLKDVY